MLDLIIKNGKVVDGSGLPAFVADVGVKDGVIVKLGACMNSRAQSTPQQSGRTGFIDPHTHFDAQLLVGWRRQAGHRTRGHHDCAGQLLPVIGAAEGRASHEVGWHVQSNRRNAAQSLCRRSGVELGNL